MVSPSISVISNETIQANQQVSFSLLSVNKSLEYSFRKAVCSDCVNTPAGQISIRGVGGNPNTDVLTLIDGRPQYMGLMGHPVADSYLSAHIDRVEIIRGPASLLYGSNAMEVLLILLPEAQHFREFPVVCHFHMEPMIHSILARISDMRLDHQALSFHLLTNEQTDFVHGVEFNANSGYLKSLYHINEQYTVTVDGSLTKFKTFDPGTITAPKVNNWMDIQRGYVGASVDNDFGVSKGSFRFAYNFGHHELIRTWVSDDFAAVASLYQTLSLFPDNTLTIGADMNKFGGKGHDSSKDYGTPSVYEYAVYAYMQHTLFQRLILNGGLRYDNNELFGGVVIPQVGARIQADR